MRAVLMLIFCLVGFLPVLFGLKIMNYRESNRAYNEKVDQLTEYGSLLAGRISTSGYFQHAVGSELGTEIATYALLNNARVMIINDGLVVVKDTRGQSVGKTLISKDVIAALQGKSVLYKNKPSQVTELYLPIWTDGAEHYANYIQGVLAIHITFEDIVKQTESAANSTALILVAHAVLLLIIAYELSKHLTAPLQRLSERVHNITEKYQDIDNGGKSAYLEIERISEEIRLLMERVEMTEKSRQEFVSSVSHELKTPLAAIKVLADSLVLEPNVPIEMYREFITDIDSEIDRESQIVNDLLTLVKMDKTDGKLQITRVDINRLAETILKRLMPLALKRGIEMSIESYRPVVAEVDEVKISLVLTNLIENAIKYNKDG